MTTDRRAPSPEPSAPRLGSETTASLLAILGAPSAELVGSVLISAVLVSTVVLSAALAEPLRARSNGEPLTFEELMQVRTIEGAVISADGRFVAWAETPDRGDGEGVVKAAGGGAEHRVERGAAPAFSADGAWVAFRVDPSFSERTRHEQARTAKEGGKNDGSAPRPGLALLETATGRRIDWQRVADFAFSDDGELIAIHLLPDEEREDPSEPAAASEEPAAASGTPEEEPQEPPARRKAGGDLVVRRLASGDETRIAWVDRYAWNHNLGGHDLGSPELAGRIGADGSRRSPRLAYAVDDPEGATNRLVARRFGDRPSREQILHTGPWASYPSLAWARARDRLAFLAGIERSSEGSTGESPAKDPADGWEVTDLELRVWNANQEGTILVTADEQAGEGWTLPAWSALAFDRGDDRLYFGYAVRRAAREEEREERDASPASEAGDVSEGSAAGEPSQSEAPIDPYDREAILAERTVDVWHWDDPLIVPHQKQRFEQERKRTYLAVAHLDTGDPPRVVRLADLDLPDVERSDATWTVARSELPYRKQLTWEGEFHDLYLVSTQTGERIRLAERVEAFGQLSRAVSPSGTSVAFYRDGDWHLIDREAAAAGRPPRNLTAALGVSFADEDHDYPEPAPGYGIAGWVADGEPARARDRAVLLYDKYDLWRVPLDPQQPAVRLTIGREEERVFRLVDLERGHRDARGYRHLDDEVLYLAYHDRAKNDAFFTGTLAQSGARPLHTADRRFRVLAAAERADALLYTEESYSTFPDLWVSTERLADRRRLSDVNPQLAERDLGSAELVEWLSLDGQPLQGVLIKPAGYQPGQRVPVLVYFYRFFSQRLHEFNEPKVNHRPSFPIYATDGYAIFLPDIRFEVGRPGLAAVKALLPGVQRLIDLGVADPDAIGLHGHSWSGYQTAFIVTQTDRFKAAVAGAPVANMTSAYSGIRWGSGMARQFQYEQSQSRIGGTLWDRRDLYIDNSPVFFADRIHTPLLILHGDDDGAVPWYQSIELYLALRRLGKPAVFLQYRGEDHHPAKDANKLDWAIKMKEFFDHHLKGEPAPAWWSEGVPHDGR